MTEKNNSLDKQRDNKGRFLPGHDIGNKFQPGESGNPNGRPLKDLCITSIAKEMLEEIAPGTEPDPKTYAQLIAKVILQEAMKGNIPALKELLDRIEGKVTDTHKIMGDVPVSIVYKLKGDK